MKTRIGGTTIELVQGDITGEKTDAIVNAANETLLGGGGVDGAIHRAGGRTILKECLDLGGCKTGDAKITSAGTLFAKHVIHAVGPVWRGGGSGEADLLASCYRRSLEIASEHGIRSLAFPAISTGAYGYPIAEAARVALETIMDHLRDHPGIDRVRIVLFTETDLAEYEKTLHDLVPVA